MQIGLFLVLLDVVTILLGPDFPIDMPRIVAARIFAVLHEFDRLTEIRAAVNSGEETFDDVAGRTSRCAIRATASGCKNLLESEVIGQFVFFRRCHVDQLLDDVVRRDAFAFGREVHDQAVPQNRLGQGLDVFGRDVRAAVEQARALAPRTRNCTARGRRPNSIDLERSRGAPGSRTRVCRTSDSA